MQISLFRGALEAGLLPDMPGTRIFREGCPKSWRLYGKMIDI